MTTACLTKQERPQFPRFSPNRLIIVCGLILFAIGCGKQSAPSAPATENPGSQIQISAAADGARVDTPSAEFVIAPNGYVAARLLTDHGKLSLDDAGNDSGIQVTAAGKHLPDAIFDVAHPQISEPRGRLGTRGKRIEVTSENSVGDLRESLVVEVYDDFPNIALVSASIRNSGSREMKLDAVDLDRHRLNATLADSKVAPNEMWSFHGASIEWGKDNVFKIPKKFSQQNQMGSLVEVKGDLGRVGGGIPVVAFWTKTVGEAIGHVETLPLVLSIPVETETDGLVDASVHLKPDSILRPGEAYSTPQTFIAVYSGDYYEPLRMYSDVIDGEGLKKPTTNGEDYAVSWCGWAYLANVTPAQMLGTIPKLKEFGIHWATLDDRWFNNYGDWQPRSDTFPGDEIRKMVRQFHEQGIKVQLWWLPLAVEDGGPGYESHPYGVSEVVKQHPDWLILDKNGKPARMARNLATLCPAVPEVREYYKHLTEKFIRDWDFDGHKLDNIYSVPACYNPKHHHKSPYDSVYAMGDIYKTIFETTRALKPDSVTQSCPCGTPPSIAWLRYIDQAVTADPVGSVQVRQRVKMYKALLGPNSAVYGDHVELTRIANPNGDEKDLGSDFASTVGTGGVVGTKFAWPDYGPKLSDVYLTPQKEEYWKKWIGLYNEKMLSRGTFRNLYVYGYDEPEGYAIEKDGVMYYAFFAPQSATGANHAEPPAWSGEIELRGLAPGKYHVVDYVDGKDLGEVIAPNAKLKTSFADHLLIEVTTK
ncbi:MAG: glycoside hydrolase family 36 protein [Candidatus Acidiferrales bacterium]